MRATLMDDLADIGARFEDSIRRQQLKRTTSRRRALVLRCQPEKGYRMGSAHVEVEGLGRCNVEYESLDGTIQVRPSLLALERFLARTRKAASV